MGVQNQVYHKIALMRGKGVINWFNQWIQGHPFSDKLKSILTFPILVYSQILWWTSTFEEPVGILFANVSFKNKLHKFNQDQQTKLAHQSNMA